MSCGRAPNGDRYCWETSTVPSMYRRRSIASRVPAMLACGSTRSLLLVRAYTSADRLTVPSTLLCAPLPANSNPGRISLIQSDFRSVARPTLFVQVDSQEIVGATKDRRCCAVGAAAEFAVCEASPACGDGVASICARAAVAAAVSTPAITATAR